MASRRSFLASAAAGAALASQNVLGANDRIRIGIIGSGARGQQLMKQAVGLPDVQMVAAADVFTRRLQEALAIAPGIATFLNYRDMLARQDLDAVIIATPQHLHAEHFVATMQAGKHCYQEKTMAFTVEHAKQMRAAYRNAKGLTVTIGHHINSSGEIIDARNFYATSKVGKITMVHMHMYRNTPHGQPQWSREVLPDMTAENILWKSFQGDAPPHDFDPNRYINWRFFWEYSGGNFYENMCHQLAFWYEVLAVKIPLTATTVGGVYLWKDGREVPDTMSTAFQHPEEFLLTWDSCFGNNKLGVEEYVLGTDGTLARTRQVHYWPEKINNKTDPERTGSTKAPPDAHMRDFVDAIRTGRQTNCPFEIGFNVSIAARMAVEAYRQQRTIRWDPEKEEMI